MKTIEELCGSDIECATCESIGVTITSDTNPEAAQVATSKLKAYLRHFAIPSATCIRCGAEQGGMYASITGTGFQYGLVHGEGTCGTCGYPARTVHKVEGVGTLSNLILQYHPLEVEVNPPR